MEWIHVPERNLPSTYQQVIRNMLYIQEEVLPTVETVREVLEPEVERHSRYIEDAVEPAIDALYQEVIPTINMHSEVLDDIVLPAVEDVRTVLDPAVAKLNDTIFNPNAGNKSDVVMGSDGIMKVIGMRTGSLSGDKANSSDLETYGRNITSGTVSAESVGLAGRFGVNSEYVTLFTMIPTDGAPGWQLAIGDDAVGGSYVRTADESGGWGDWMRTPYKQFLYSVNPPPSDKQDMGECWFQEVYPPSKYHLSDVTDPLNLDYIDINDESWERICAVSVETGEEIAPAMEDLDLMDLVGTLSFMDMVTHHEYDFTVDSMEEFVLHRIDGEGDDIPFRCEDVSFINVPLFRLSSVSGECQSDVGLNSQDAMFALQPLSASADSEDGFMNIDLEDQSSYALDTLS